jgi:hypothetical protein
VVIFIGVYCFVSGSLFYYAQRTAKDLEGAVSSYQGYARSLAILFLYARSLVVGRPIRLLFLTLIGGASLFVSGARSEFLGFLLVYFVLIAIGVLNVNSGKVSASPRLLLVLLLSLVVFTALGFYVLGSGLDSRILQLADLESANSYIARQDLLQVGMINVSSSPILGIFGGHIAYTGSSGGYIHNILSAWAGFGLPAFLLILYLQLSALRGSYLLAKRIPSGLCWLAFELNLFSSFLLFTTKSIFWIVPPLGWGLFLQISLSSAFDYCQKQRHLLER